MAGVVDTLGLVGATIDQVRFDACVDSGGFGLVYRGRHLGLDEAVAIKCLRIASANPLDAELKEAIAARFRDETKLLYRLSQGNLDIVRCIGGGTLNAPRTGELTPYMILEWLEGQPLAMDLRDRRERGLAGRSLAEVMTLLDPAARALAYAHAQDVVHRDVKPGNFFLARTREGMERVKVLDFGLAKILDDESLGVRPTAMTQQGVHFCSPSYGAPEQYSPSRGRVGPWTDVYAFALVVLELLLGKKVRPASSLAEGVVAALDPESGSPTASSLGLQLPREVEEVLARAVSQETTARPRDLGVLWSELKRAFDLATRATDLASTAPETTSRDAMAHVNAAAAAAKDGPHGKTAPGGAPAAPAPPFAATLVMGDAGAQAQAQAAAAAAAAQARARGDEARRAAQAPPPAPSSGRAAGAPPRPAAQQAQASPPAPSSGALPPSSGRRQGPPTGRATPSGSAEDGTSTTLVVVFVLALLVALAGGAAFVARFVLHR